MSAATEADPAADHRPGLNFAGVFAVTFCGLVGVGSVLPVLPRYIHGPIGAGDVAVGVVIGAYAVTGLLLRPVAGRFADTRGRKPTVLVGAMLVALSGLLYLPALGIAGLIVARLILGAGEGAVYTAGSAWIVDLAPEERRGRVLGLYGLAVWGGLSVGPLLGEVLLDAGGYDLVWIVAAALPVLGALIALAARDPFVPLAHAEPHPLIAPEAVGPGFAVGLASFGYAAVATFIVLHLESRGVGHGATVFAAFAAMIVLTRLVFGDLPDRMGAAPVAIAATVGEACGLLLIAVAHSLPVALLGGVRDGRRLRPAQPLADADRPRPRLPAGARRGDGHLHRLLRRRRRARGADRRGRRRADQLRGRLHLRRRRLPRLGADDPRPPAPGAGAPPRLALTAR